MEWTNTRSLDYNVVYSINAYQVSRASHIKEVHVHACIIIINYCFEWFVNSGREEMLCMLENNSSPLITHESQRWTLVEDDLEEVTKV